jgi:hypothetical protein
MVECFPHGYTLRRVEGEKVSDEAEEFSVY